MRKQVFFVLGFLLCISAFGQSNKYKEGYYFTKDGKKVSGLLHFSYGGSLFTDKSDGDCSLSFKTDKSAKKQKFTPSQRSLLKRRNKKGRDSA